MKIISTAILLGITLLVVPVVSYFFGTPPDAQTWAAIHTLLIILGAAILYCFIVGEISGNNSQVDKLWSLLPIAYVWVVASYGDFTLRLVVMSILVTIWGIRLTTNFAMKGAFEWKFWAGEEDYRWEVLRKKPGLNVRWKWALFNLFFISGYQLTLILLFTMPIVVALQFNDVPMGILDWVAGGLMLFFIIYETVADIQHWNYQSTKWKKIRNKETLTGDYEKGFLDKGLWALSRHPNYFAEQAIWVSFYLFSVAASGEWINWSIAGCLLLIVLFMGSSQFSEEISAGKYPQYADYQKRVPRFFPIGKK